ncbi:MAG TPA: hypothetical protein VFW97_15325 [Acidimicrobiia bacterium]|nr:hypothetical protein [Acidimicrobiia bacterium]
MELHANCRLERSLFGISPTTPPMRAGTGPPSSFTEAAVGSTNNENKAGTFTAMHGHPTRLALLMMAAVVLAIVALAFASTFGSS